MSFALLETNKRAKCMRAYCIVILKKLYDGRMIPHRTIIWRSWKYCYTLINKMMEDACFNALVRTNDSSKRVCFQKIWYWFPIIQISSASWIFFKFSSILSIGRFIVLFISSTWCKFGLKPPCIQKVVLFKIADIGK